MESQEVIRDPSVFAVSDTDKYGLLPPTTPTLVRMIKFLRLMVPCENVEIYELPPSHDETLFIVKVYDLSVVNIIRVWFSGQKIHLIYMVIGLMSALRPYCKEMVYDAVVTVFTSQYLSDKQKVMIMVETLIQALINGVKSEFHLCLLHALLTYIIDKKVTVNIFFNLSAPSCKNTLYVDITMDQISINGIGCINAKLNKTYMKAITGLVAELHMKYPILSKSIQLYMNSSF